MRDIRSVCVYCGAAGAVAQVHRDAAAGLGRLLAEAGVTLVYGGGKVGLMGLMADAALAAGGRVIGIIPESLVRLEVGHGGASELIVVSDMHARKQRMFELSDAFAVLPGGLGTLDETFEMLTWKQLRFHDKPIVVVDVAGFWQPFLALVEAQIAAGFVRPAHRGLMTVVDSVEAVLPACREAPPGDIAADAKWK
ncbi:MAG: TIGR00730 family Rossman fold protein [Thalassobaculales bacterium]